MIDTSRNDPPSDRIGGGGAATSAGIRFQQQLGAMFASWILAGDRFDAHFRLGADKPEWVRFETEAPVDDLLIKTTGGGYVAVQAKTTVSLSEDPNSQLGRTIAQFVRYWVSAQQGDGSMGWNRPLDLARDRLVLAVSSRATVQVREDLPTALRLASQTGGGALNRAQQRAYQAFAKLVEHAWATVTKSAVDDRLRSELEKLVVVLTFDEDLGEALASASLVKAVDSDVDAATAFTVLCDLSGRLMKERSGGDRPTWRQLLLQGGIKLGLQPEYRADIEALKRHSTNTAKALSTYEKIDVNTSEPLTVPRDCQAGVEAAVRDGPLLIIGEPGAGKSAVLNALARTLSSVGSDVLELAVDRYSVESIEGLSRELGLQHPLLDVLEAWDGPEQAYLVIDALDATRGGRGEGVFRALIERVMELKGRWTVVASIRSFDLRMGQRFRVLFKGVPPEKPSFADSSFGEVRHIQVPPWSEDEFEQLLRKSPPLANCLTPASARLRELAMVPFNTRLISELISANAVGDLDDVSSQADLLRLYWDHRVGGHGLPAKTCLSNVVRHMAQARALRAPTLQAAGDHPAILEALCKEGVLVFVDSERWVQFRHHLLFDYAAARLLLEPSDIISGAYRFTKADALGLMLSPALGFVLREIWESESGRARFWAALGAIISDEDGDPIIRSNAARSGAEFPSAAGDCIRLGDLAVSGDEAALKTLSHVSGALAVRVEDEKQVELDPWVYLAECLATAPEVVAGPLRFLLHNLIERVKDDALRPLLGQAARSLLAHGLKDPNAEFAVRGAIGFVIDTYETDTAASRAVLARLFERDRLDQFGHNEIPEVCYKIAAVGDVDPEFVTDIYRYVFTYEVTEDRETQIGQSQIVSLTSNARQDYGMARWSLGEYLPQFLEDHPRAAVRAVVHALQGYISREHPISGKALDVELEVCGQTIRLQEDLSYVWAHDPDKQYGQDADILVGKLRARLRGAPEAEAMALLEILLDEATFAVIWSRMFLCAVERNDSLIEKLWPIAATEAFLVLPDTRKDAIDVVAIGFGGRPRTDQQALEQAALAFDFSRFQYRAKARQAFLERLFIAIGRDNLVTDDAREILDTQAQDEITPNERLFAVKVGDATPEDFYWIEGLDQQAPENAAVIKAINTAKGLLHLELNSEEVATASLAESLGALDAIQASLVAGESHAGLRRYAEAIIGQGCGVIVSRKLLASKEAPPTSEQDRTFVELLVIAATSEGPESDDDTEARFEEFASWGGPAARVEAAEACWDLFVHRSDLFPDLASMATELLSDRHPAVRLNALVRLGNIWDIDRDQFWHLLISCLAREANLAVIEHMLSGFFSRLIHTDPEQSLKLLLGLLQREVAGADRARRLRKAVADKLSILWLTYQLPEAKTVLDDWLSTPCEHAGEVQTILSSLRGAIVAGLGDNPDKDAGLRQRSQALISDVVDAANTRLGIRLAASQPNEAATAEARECARLIDIACNQMFFSIGGTAAQGDSEHVLDRARLAIFLGENADLLRRIGEYATPHTTYSLLQLIERLVYVDAAVAFDLAANSVLAARRFGYQNESLAANLMVRLVGVFLADYKEIFEDRERRAALVECLEAFMEAGWPAARRLLYRLPELIQ